MTSLRHACCHFLASATASLLISGVASATVLYSGTMTLGAASPTQLGRLTRDGVDSDWSAQKAFPGVINATTTYHYTTLDLDLGALESSFGAYGPYIQISFDSTATTTFLSAYLGSYSPASIATNYLGDPGGSGNLFGVDPEFFQIVVPSSNHLILVLNESTTNGGLNLPGDVLVEAFSDTDFTDLPVAAPVPEPGTWALLLGGLGFVAARRRSGGAVRSRSHQA
jgi:hypothetical protein